MGILDRFKTQPKWKHADAEVRLAGVHELPEADQDVLAEVARTDDDARVRKAAVGKLGTVGTLAEILRADADESVRDQAAGVLLDIALGAFEADEASSLAAVDAFGALPAAPAQKQIVLVAKTAKRESVSQAALGRLGRRRQVAGHGRTAQRTRAGADGGAGPHCTTPRNWRPRRSRAVSAMSPRRPSSRSPIARRSRPFQRAAPIRRPRGARG